MEMQVSRKSKLFCLVTALLMVLVIFIGAGTSVYASDLNGFSQEEIKGITNNGQYGEYDNNLTIAAEKLSKYFVIKDNRLEINSNADTISKEINVSKEDAQLMIDAAKELPTSIISPRGFVGVYINLGPKVRKMSGWAAGTFAAGYVGFYLKQFAVNPVTAGVVAVISAGTGAAVKWAVENGIRRVPVGKNIPGLNMSFNVNVP